MMYVEVIGMSITDNPSGGSGRSERQFMSFQEYREHWMRTHDVELKEKETFFDKWLALGYRCGCWLARTGLSANGVSILALVTALLSGIVILLAGAVLEPVTPQLLVTSGFGWPAAFLPPMGFLPALGYQPSFNMLLAGLLLILGFALFLLSGFLDVLDGAVARVTRTQSTWGSFFEQVMDKYADAFVVVALIVARFVDAFWGVLALLGFIMVDYARAEHRAEGVRMTKVTLGERPFRILLLSTAAGGQILSYLAVALNVVVPLGPAFYLHQLTLEALRYATFLLVFICHLSAIQISLHTRRILAQQAQPQPER